MAGTDSGNNSLIVEFERSYADTLSTLTHEDGVNDRSGEGLTTELEAKVQRFTDLARQMETFFLQKQFLLYSQKPELHLKDDSNELKVEIARKEELLQKHNQRLGVCLKMLQEVQQQHKAAVTPSSGPGSGSTTPAGPSSPMPRSGTKGLPQPPGLGPRMGGPGTTGTRMVSPQGGGGHLAYLEKTTTSIGAGSNR